MQEMRKIIYSIAHKKIAVIGDLILDKYIFGNVDRISPEAPIPIVLVNKENFALGGAANVAANISTLGGNAFLFGILGNDQAQEKVLQISNESNINTSGIFIDDEKHTIEKIRVIGQHQQLLRIDYEDGNYIEENVSSYFIDKLLDVAQLDMIIISDYAKGTISNKLINDIKIYAQKNNIPLIVDPKPKHKDFYKGVTLLTPNLKEAQELSGIYVTDQTSLEQCGKKLNEIYNCDIIITTGEKGLSIFPIDDKITHIPTQAVEVYDVSGAGDTFIASLSLAITTKSKLESSARFANYAAGIKVTKLGTAPVHFEELAKLFD
ncbi:MAG: D-glycero-beta-D-manno-heptose-7-phosphate kinase [Candidatus Cloacimonetes bacterium]|nr:D-glycero-beta-D-manno-heptose-7-phosphate kinase [Candidatus Cloacimonadota bacterium]